MAWRGLGRARKVGRESGGSKEEGGSRMDDGQRDEKVRNEDLFIGKNYLQCKGDNLEPLCWPLPR